MRKEYKEEMDKNLELLRNTDEKDIERRKTITNNIKTIIHKDKEDTNKILHIIDRIKEEYEKDNGGYAKSTFTEGGCYYFSVMLKKIFPEAEIYVHSCFHSITKIYGSFYDAGGKVDDLTNNILKDFHTVTEEEFAMFSDLCSIPEYYREEFERECDNIVDRIIEEENINIESESKNNFKIV